MMYLNQFLMGVCFGGGFIVANVISHKLFGVGL